MGKNLLYTVKNSFSFIKNGAEVRSNRFGEKIIFTLGLKIQKELATITLNKGVANLLLDAGQIFVCKFSSGHNRCSNQSNVLMPVNSKILRYRALGPDFSISSNRCSLKKKRRHSKSGSDLQFSSPKSGVP